MKNRFSHAAPYIAHLKGIEQLIVNRKLQEAAEQLNQLVKQEPQDPRLFLLGSSLARASRNPEGMLLAARKAHQLAPQWPTALLHLGTVLAGRGDADEAMALSLKAVQGARQQATLDIETLSTAAAIAYDLGRFTQAQAWLQQAEQLKPSDPAIAYKIGLCLSSSGQWAEAIGIFTQLLEQRPNDTSVLAARRQAALGAKEMSLAAQDAEALLAIAPDDEEHQYFLAIARGETPPTQPASVIALLFNGLAVQFDQNMVVKSQYKLPRDVAQMVHAWYLDAKSDVLDLGCGTGLLGVCLRPMEGVLVGVDLSEGMIAQAQRHNVYDSFHLVNVLDALEATPPALYDVIAALDVFIYIGDLSTVIPNAYRILLPGGRFVFSCETSTSDSTNDYALNPTQRYSHQPDYVQRLLAGAGFSNVVIEERVIRLESGVPVVGFLATAQKPLKKKNVRRSPKSAKPAPLEQ